MYQVTGSGVSLGLAAAIRTLPALCMSPLAGVLSDRYDRRSLLKASHLIKSLIAAIFWAVAAFSDPDILTLYGLILLLGLITTFDAPIRRGLVRVIVPQDILTEAASLHTAVISVGRILGPAIGGLLIVLFGTSSCFLANSLCAFAGCILLLRIKILKLDTDSSAKTSTGFLTAVSYAWSNQLIRLTFLYLAIICMTVWNLEVILPVLVEEQLAGGSTTFSLLLVTFSVGSLVGSLGAAEKALSPIPMPAVLFGMSATGVCLSFAPNTATVCIFLILIGALGGTFLGTANARVQINVDPQYHGRIVALYTIIFIGMRSTGSLILGFLTESFGAPWAIRIGSIGNAILVGFVLVASRANDSTRKTL